ncbi:MAG: acyl-CoA thioesterase [Spirochaetota bacterium]
MHRASIELRVRYAETDQMGVAHHSCYFVWMEASRTELLRNIGISYREMERMGYFLPVKEAYCRYRSRVFYDDIVIVESELVNIGGASIKIAYRMYIKDRENKIFAEGYTLHPFTDKKGKVVKIPEFIRRLLA